jgi:hypothetical protein
LANSSFGDRNGCVSRVVTAQRLERRVGLHDPGFVTTITELESGGDTTRDLKVESDSLFIAQLRYHY